MGPGTHHSKPNEARLLEGKFALFHMLATVGEAGGGHLSKSWLSPHPQQSGDTSFYTQKEGAETAQSALSVTFTLVIGGLTSVILIVLSTVNL